jgi:hypothetical protein
MNRKGESTTSNTKNTIRNDLSGTMASTTLCGLFRMRNSPAFLSDLLWLKGIST